MHFPALNTRVSLDSGRSVLMKSACVWGCVSLIARASICEIHRITGNTYLQCPINKNKYTSWLRMRIYRMSCEKPHKPKICRNKKFTSIRNSIFSARNRMKIEICVLCSPNVGYLCIGYASYCRPHVVFACHEIFTLEMEKHRELAKLDSAVTHFSRHNKKQFVDSICERKTNMRQKVCGNPERSRALTERPTEERKEYFQYFECTILPMQQHKSYLAYCVPWIFVTHLNTRRHHPPSNAMRTQSTQFHFDIKLKMLR